MGKKRKPTQNSLEISLSFWITRKHGQTSTTRECGEVQLGGLSGRARRAIRILWQELNLENEEIMEELCGSRRRSVKTPSPPPNLNGSEKP